MMNCQRPLTLDFKTFCESTGLDYNNGNYVAHPSPKVVKAELAKIPINEALVNMNHALKNLRSYGLDDPVNFWTKVDIGEIIYNDLVTRITAKSRKRYVSYPGFLLCALSELLGSDYAHDQKFRSLPNALS
ncbi:hypothetical protein Tco_1215049 [Tanacetum coccineum]